ncbi:MAG: ATP-dependent DNA helicase RecG [Sporolactobacillus sp.]
MNKDNLPVDVLKGVGTALADQLKSLDILTVDDLFNYYPYRYENYSVKDLGEAQDGEHLTITGKVQSEALFSYYAKKRSRISVRVLSGRYLLTAIAFNRPYLKKSLKLGSQVTLTGKWERARATLVVSEFHIGSPVQKGEFMPVYPVKDGITVKRMRAIVRQALTLYNGRIEETLPRSLLDAYRLMGRNEAIHQIHFPTATDRLKQARRRLVYEEFLVYELKMQAHRLKRQKESRGIPMNVQSDWLKRFTEALPFTLTHAQHQVTEEILADLTAAAPMNRLLQGDVGSGKTIVAAISLFAAVTAGFQGALMAPTEILAEQHADSLEQLFAPFSVNVALLTGNVRGKKRKQLLEQLEQGTIKIIVGTHALIQEGVRFQRLGLVVTDEQHRFGVQQRRLLRNKGAEPDVLYMTATPIPRTLAISVFGDMDVSTINEMPLGRKKIKTYWVRHEMMDRVIGFIRKTVSEGRQVYVVCPLIEESEQLDVQNAIDVHALLTEKLKPYKIGLMHGRLTPDEKTEVMNQFKQDRLDVLVSTTVVEVGVNVPNATLMVIYDADRFGLSQLHQLRGRVGRASNQSYCVLVAEAKSEISREKMKLMTETTDGFELSEFDLKLRGPGDFFGKKQSGVPDFKLGDMVHDFKTLVTARSDATHLVRDPAFWKDEVFLPLRQPLLESGILEKTQLD